MLGLADRGRVRHLLGSILAGDAAVALGRLDEAHALGIDPSALLRGLMESVHAITRAKAGATGDVLASAEEREAAAELAGQLGWGTLHRLWQLLLKGLTDVQVAPDPQEAAAMTLLRVVHAADLPDPAALIARLQGGEASSPVAAATSAAKAGRATTPQAQSQPAGPESFQGVVEALERGGKALMSQQLHDQVGLVRFAPGQLEIKPLRPLGTNFARDLADALKQISGSAWQVALSDGEAEPSLLQQEQMSEERARAAVLADPNVAAVLSAFPGATLESITKGADHAQL